MNLRYIQGGMALLFLTGAIVVGCGGSEGEEDDGGKGGSSSSTGGKGGAPGGNAGTSSAGGKGGTAGTGGTGGGAGGATGGTGGGTAGAGGTGGGAGAAGSSPDAGVDAPVDAPVTMADASPDTNVDAAPLPAGLLAHEPFGAVGRLSASAAGAGWGAPWSVHDDDVLMAGYQVVNTTPLTFMTLASSPTYAIGGQSYRESGRALDVSAEGAFKDFLSTPNLIGKAGKSLWISFLFRRDATDDTDTKVSFHSSGTPYWDGDMNGPTTFAFGFFGEGSKTDNTRYWSLRLRTADAPVKTTVAITPGQTVFVVMNVAFTETGGTVAVYLNPASLGAAAPATPSAQATATMPLTFKSLAFYPGNGSGSAAIDEIRVGTSYAAVTPAN